MMKNKQYLQIDLYNGKSKWISEKDFLLSTVGDEYDGKDSKGYYFEYTNGEKEYYNWKDNFDSIKRTPTHTIYKGEESMLIDFSNKKLDKVSWLKENK